MTRDGSLLENVGSVDAGASLFDGDGRRIPAELTSAVHKTTRRRFVCTQPEIDYAAIHRRIGTHLKADGAITAAEFERRAEAILERLRGDGRTAAVVNAVRVPFFLPRVLDARSRDIGQDLDQLYLTAVRASFEEKFPTYRFTNHDKDGLAGRLTVAPGSRHERLLEAMQADVVVGWCFVSLLEYSVPAAIEQMAGLPEAFLLGGGADICAAFVGSPDLLLRTEGYSPLIWLSGLESDRPQTGYHFEPYGYNLTFNRRVHLAQAAEYWASALVVLG